MPNETIVIAARNEPNAILTMHAVRADFDAFLTQAIVPDDRDRTVIRQLTIIAEMRQASVSEATYRLYGRALRAYDLVDIHAAVTHYRRYPREQGETAMPDLPSLEGVVKKYRAERKQAERMELERLEIEREKEQVERERSLGHDVSNPVATDEALARITARLSADKALKDGDAARRRETAERAREAAGEVAAARRQRVSSCAKCDFFADMTPKELRQLADHREALQSPVPAVTESVECAA